MDLAKPRAVHCRNAAVAVGSLNINADVNVPKWTPSQVIASNTVAPVRLVSAQFVHMSVLFTQKFYCAQLRQNCETSTCVRVFPRLEMSRKCEVW